MRRRNEPEVSGVRAVVIDGDTIEVNGSRIWLYGIGAQGLCQTIS